MSKILQMLQGMAGDAVKNAQDDDILGINQQSQSVNPMLGMIDVNGNAIATPAVENEVSPSEDLAINPELAEKFGMSEKDVYQGGQALKTAQTLDVIRQKPQEQRNEEEQTLFKTITQKAGEFFGNEENMLNMALAFNTLRFQPDQQLAAGIQNRLQTIQERKTNQLESTMIYNQLMEMGETDAAAMVKSSPESAKDILKQIVQKKFAKGASPTVSGVQVDPNTGQQYVVVTDPTTGLPKKKLIEGAVALTPYEKAELENEQKEKQFGIEQAQKRSEDMLSSLNNVESQISNLNTMLDALDNGADTGIIRNYLPAFNQATSSLRAAANKLGIDIIDSVTFGALSESELNLALRTAIDTSLNPTELRKQIEEKMAAQKKLRDELKKDALTLARGGITFNEFVRSKLEPQGRPASTQAANPVQVPPTNTDLQKELQRRGLN
jgi:hypothetical protein